MKRKRIIAKLLALSLVFSGLPMTSLHAAELPAAAEKEAQEDEEGPAADSAAEENGEETAAAQKETSDGQENGDSVEQENDTPDEQENSDPVGQENDTPDEQENGDPVGQENDTPDEQENNTPDEQTKGVTMLEDSAEAGVYEGIAADVKIAGSDGILYGDVAYLSARNVMAMDEDMQNLYRSLCDDIAYSKAEGLDVENVVFAVNADGDLYCNYYVPGVVLEEIGQEFVSGVNEVLTPAAEENKGDASDTPGGDQTSEEQKGDETGVSDGEQKGDETGVPDEEQKEDEAGVPDEEQKEDETGVPDGEQKEDETGIPDGEQKEDETGVPDGEQEDNETGVPDGEQEDNETGVPDQEKKDDENAVPDQEKKDDENAVPDLDAVEKEEKEDEPAASEEIPEEESALFEENMDLLPDVEEETFEEIESVRVENTIDLGYGSMASGGNGAGGITIASVLPSGNYFVNQLTSKQRQYYNSAKGRLIAGNNSFSFQDSIQERSSVPLNVAHAISALVLTYPDKTDWMAKPGGFTCSGLYRRGAATANYTVTLGKSKFYNGSLNSEAKSKVQAVCNLAMQHAAEEYQKNPVYGIIEYFDQWICENGYYEMAGTESGRKDAVYYYCHSAYGILLKGYGVCESYAKAMSRLLDAVGIPNIYVVGDAGGSHAWNYVQMPDGKWYLLDSTWNDTIEKSHTYSEREYLLVKDDGIHRPSGRHYSDENHDFTFPERETVDYAPNGAETVTLSETVCNLTPKATVTLTYQIGGGDIYKGVWSSSNTKVATVSSGGKVTAKASGTAVISCSVAGMVAQCTVNVDQIKSVKVKESKKTKEKITLGISEANRGVREIVLAVDMGASPHSAEWMVQQSKTKQPAVTYSKQGVVTAETELKGNEIRVKVQAEKTGKADVKVKFGGKTVTLQVSAGQLITREMFTVTWPTAVQDADGSKTTVYTGKAVKPKIKKNSDAAYKKVTYSVKYVNNINAGSAKVVISGTGKYGGTVEYPFTITPIDITGADFSKALKSKAYNGGSNAPATEVKLGKKKLKAGRDYEILYNGRTAEEVKGANAGTIPVGSYTISIRGKGNYAGNITKTQTYQVTQNTIAKLKVSGSSSVKYTGLPVKPYTIKIGSNVLPASDYTITWYSGQGKTKSAAALSREPIAKGKYTAVITVKGDNLTTTTKKRDIVKKLTIK